MSTRQVRVSADVSVRVGRLADHEKRSFANMVNMLLVSALEDGGWETEPVLTERRVDGPSAQGIERAAGAGPLVEALVLPKSQSPRSVSAESVPPPKDNTVVRPHMKKNRPAVECPTRVFVNGVCPDCGAEQ